MTGMRRTMLLLGAALPATATLLGGCYYSHKTTTEPVAAAPPSTVVVTPSTPAPAVVVPAVPAPSVAVAPTTVVTQRVVTYPEGRYQLMGDSTTGYYWVWVSTGSVGPMPPVPPQLNRRIEGSTVVMMAPTQREIVYPEGRYQLYGDATSGYYWVWIPNGVVLRYAPPPIGRLSQGP